MSVHPSRGTSCANRRDRRKNLRCRNRWRARRSVPPLLSGGKKRRPACRPSDSCSVGPALVRPRIRGDPSPGPQPGIAESPRPRSSRLCAARGATLPPSVEYPAIWARPGGPCPRPLSSGSAGRGGCRCGAQRCSRCRAIRVPQRRRRRRGQCGWRIQRGAAQRRLCGRFRRTDARGGGWQHPQVLTAAWLVLGAG